MVLAENQQNNDSVGIGFIIAIAIVIAELGGMGLLYMQNISLQEQFDSLAKTSVLKHELTFELLPEYIKKAYTQTSGSAKSTNKQSEAVQTGTVNVLDFSQSNQLVLNNSKLALLGELECGDMMPGSYKLTIECENKLKTFLLSFNQEYVYEVISLTQGSDILSVSDVINALATTSIKQLEKGLLANNFTKFVKDGLGMNRIQEVVDRITLSFGEDTNILINPHREFSNHQSGFRLRVYNAL